MSPTSVKKSPLATWFRKAIALVSVGAAIGLAAACGSDDKPADVHHVCKLNSECADGLVCSFGLCHAECEKYRDCPANQLCITLSGADGGPSTRVCQLQDEAKCVFDSECKKKDPLLVCAADLHCRN